MGLLSELPGLPSGKHWETRPAAAWTQEESLELLTRSPWTVQVEMLHATGRQLAVFSDGRRAVYRASPQSPPRLFTEGPHSIEPEYVRAVYAVRWSSAVAVQEALKRLEEFSPAVKEMQAEPPELPADTYVLTARVVTPPSETPVQRMERERTLVENEAGHPEADSAPHVADILAGLTEEELRGRARLVASGKRQTEPARALRHGLGTGEGISFFFPREVNGTPTLPAGTAWAEFVLEGRKGDKLKARFKMKDMVYQGKADF